MAASLTAALPKPKYTGEDEDIPAHAQQRGPRIVGAGEIDESQIVLRRTGPPPYGQRRGWRPRGQEDFGDGGAFPEIPVAQYPLLMGKEANTSNALAIQVDGEGRVKYDAIAKQGHGEGRIVHSSFKDLIPLRQRADAGEINLERPSEQEVAETAERTKNALASLVSGAVASQKPKNVNVGQRKEPTFVRYTPANQMGDNSKKQDRIMKIVERQRDPSTYILNILFRCHPIPRGYTASLVSVSLLTMVFYSGTPQVQAQENTTRPSQPTAAYHAFTPTKVDCRRPRDVEDPAPCIKLEEQQGLHGPSRQTIGSRWKRVARRHNQRQVRPTFRGTLCSGSAFSRGGAATSAHAAETGRKGESTERGEFAYAGPKGPRRAYWCFKTPRFQVIA